MRSTRGYLDTLVRSARPPRASADTRAAVQPEWGPTRLVEPADLPVPSAGPPSAAPTHSAEEPASLPARPPAPLRSAPQAREPDAAPRPAENPESRRSTGDAPRPQPVEAVAPSPARRSNPAVTRASQPPAFAGPPRPDTPSDESHPAPTPVREIARPASLRLPPGTEAALERLEHLTRRFAAANLPAPEESDRRSDASPEEVVRETDAGRDLTPLVRLEPVPTPEHAPPVPPRERVEIGSIEVFVTQPASPAPAPVAASVPPARPATPPAPPGRLSRPAQTYGFGQG
ncbi:hypothetical protein [Microbacterium deminutum]|uniref:Uncharacterized protein n=1 Tax=Microbacterium deminutum TaxID=344164 RepID=A0ABP5C177_9MICO